MSAAQSMSAKTVVPPGAPAWVTPELIAETIRVWQPYYSVPLQPADALDMILAVGRLVPLLIEGAPP
jgi:hypothetical protein